MNSFAKVAVVIGGKWNSVEQSLHLDARECDSNDFDIERIKDALRAAHMEILGYCENLEQGEAAMLLTDLDGDVADATFDQAIEHVHTVCTNFATENLDDPHLYLHLED